MDWPQNEVPEGFGQSATQDDTTSAAASSAPANEPLPEGDTPEAPLDAADPASPQRPGNGMIPKYRFDEVNERFQTVAQQNAYLQSQLQSLMQVVQRLAPNGQPQGSAPVQEQLDERETRIVAQLDRLIRHSPAWQQLQPLLERKDEVLSTADQVKGRSVQEKQHWQDVATQTMGNVLTNFATTVLGPGKTADDLSPEQHRWAREAFSSWCQMDPARVARYESQDPALVTDFITAFRGAVGGGSVTPVTPQQRAVAANTQRRAEQVRRLPTSGSASTPMGTPPAKVNQQDEDAVHAAGWQFVQSALNGSR